MVMLVGVVSVTMGVPGALGKAEKRAENYTAQRLIFLRRFTVKFETLLRSLLNSTGDTPEIKGLKSRIFQGFLG